MKIKYLVLLLTVVLTFTACKKTDNGVEPAPVIEKSTNLVLVTCEGVFPNNDACLTLYAKDSSRAYRDIYMDVNGISLGVIANSMALSGSRLLVAVDASNKVEILNATTFKRLGSVDLGANGSPRELYCKDSTVCYVTSSQNHQLVKFNPITQEILKRIPCGQYPEGLIESGSKLFVANQSYFDDQNTVTVVDMASDVKIKTITVGLNPRIMLKGSDNYIYAVCTGKYSWVDPTGRGGIYKIDPVSMTVLDSIIINKNPGEACFVGNYIYVVNSDGVFKVDFAAHSISQQPVISGTKVNTINGVISCIFYDSNSQTIYCGNCKNYSQDGEIAAFATDGTEKFRFPTGKNPGTILVK